MSEEKTEKKPSVTLEVAQDGNKKAKNRPAKSKSQENGPDIGTWFKEIRAEAGKIIWPNKGELVKMTFTVVVTSLLFGVIITGMDLAFGYGTGLLSTLAKML